MERRAPGKPYWQALANYPKHKEEIDALPRECDIIFALYPYENGKYLMEEDDFFMGLVVHCAEAKLVIELDGSQHYEDRNIKKDADRTAFLEGYGLRVIRIPNNDVGRNFCGVCEYIDAAVKQSLSQLR